MRNIFFLSLLLTISSTSFAEDIPPGSYLMVPGKIFSPARPLALKPCQIVTKIDFSEGNQATLTEKRVEPCSELETPANMRTYKLAHVSNFLCGSTYQAGMWGRTPYLIINDYRSAPAKCFSDLESLPLPLASDIAIEENSVDNQMLSTSCAACSVLNTNQ